VGDLPVTLRTCLLLREREGMSVGAIAALLGSSPAQVRDWLYEAREQLRPVVVSAPGAS
jgi:DNA-directed RNA polymerase specialized sigma24 family protein